jgi:hypothetical protein
MSGSPTDGAFSSSAKMPRGALDSSVSRSGASGGILGAAAQPAKATAKEIAQSPVASPAIGPARMAWASRWGTFGRASITPLYNTGRPASARTGPHGTRAWGANALAS